VTWNLQHNDRVDGRFTLQSPIGEGGFATVWKAHDDTTDKSVALKLPNDSSHDRSVVRSRFDQEIQILSQIANTVAPACIGHLLEWSTTRGTRYLAIEYIAGGDLADSNAATLETSQPHSETQLPIEIAQMVSFLHHNDTLHLDVKPKNLRHREDGTVALIDFNTSIRQATEDSTLFYADPYTPPELAPTEISDAATGPWSDVYSAGKTIHYLLTGVSYDLDETPAGGLNPRKDGAGCSRAVAAVIQDATKRDPSARPTNGHEFLQKLRSAAGVSEPSAQLADSQGNITVEVSPDTSVGRPVRHEPTPDIKLIDPRQHISERQFRIDWDGSRWVMHDTSLNGTYINDGTGWTWILSEDGYHQQVSAGTIDRTADQPHEAAVITDGTTIAPVDPEYGYQLVFQLNT
jgi:serine/threonine protein kinase